MYEKLDFSGNTTMAIHDTSFLGRSVYCCIDWNDNLWYLEEKTQKLLYLLVGYTECGYSCSYIEYLIWYERKHDGLIY